MKKISSSIELKEAIRLLEIDRAEKLELLKLEIQDTVQKLKPQNLVKSSIEHILGSDNLKNTLINGALGLLTGYVSKKVLTGGGDRNPVKNIIGTIIQFGIAKLVSKNAEEIKSTGRSLIKSLLSKK